MMKYASFLLLCGSLLLSGCIVQPPMRPEPSYQPAYAPVAPPVPASAGAIYQVATDGFLFSDRSAFRVGDIITIRLEEETSSSKSAGTSMSKSVDHQVLNPRVFGRGLPNQDTEDLNTLESGSEFVGEAESDQSNSLRGTLTAVVAEVMGNGLLRVQGEKWLNLNRGEEYLRVSGLVRTEDIDGNNTVSSLRLADARIAYSGTGELANSNSAGWLARFFLSPLFPF